ncbi:MAG: MFS transporter, partial [Chthoniobacteraceae bacterium]
LLLGVATANAVLLDLDRICMSAVVQSAGFLEEFKLDKTGVGDVLAMFFLAYALGQVPAGWLADRFGPRRMLGLYVFTWSLCTALTGAVGGLASLLAVRFACGLAEAGAYPASGRLITRWFPFEHRGRANSAVAFGGRIGNALALWLTALAIARFGSWRYVLWIYGAIGLVLAAATALIFRDTPSEHPWTNDAERRLIGSAPVSPARRFPWRELLRHRGLWMLSAAGIGMNVGWAFLITWLPTYLTEVRGLSKVDAGWYSSLILACGLAGVLFGGWWCDFLTRSFGPRLGRRLPFVIGSAVAICSYLACPFLKTAEAVAIACGVVAFATDSMGPAVWALGQDIGRNHVASTMAWSNMWGNLGASGLAKLIPILLVSPVHRADWSEVFWLCAGGFAVLGVAILFVDSTRGLGDEAASP